MYILKVLTQQSVYVLDRDFYYLSSEEAKPGVRVNINFNNSQLIGFVLECEQTDKTQEELSNDYGFNLKFIGEIIDDGPIISEELFELAKLLKERYMYPLIGVLQTMLPPSLRPKKLKTQTPKIKYEIFYEFVRDDEEGVLNNRENELLFKIKNSQKVAKKDQKPSKSLLKLLNLNLIKETKEEHYRYEINPIFHYHSEFELGDEQLEAYNKIVNSSEQVSLLYGVTGSGKTEVYIKLIEKYYKEGKGAIVLVPEIALTPLMISRLYSYFGDTIAVLHSSLTPAQKYDEYRSIANGDSRIVVGTRSAIFAPLKNVGIIVIDEENDESYKEDNQGLLYNAIDVAKIRAKLNNCKLVLGSATPSIDSAIKAKTGKYLLAKLTKRYTKVELPNVEIADVRSVNAFTNDSEILSKTLLNKLKTTLNSGKKAILMVNARGYSRRYYCKTCGKVYKCPKCGMPLFYHKEEGKLCCHHCENKFPLPKKCDWCGGRTFSLGAFGIERVEEDFKKIFPNTKYAVLDSDRTPHTKQIEDVLAKFESGEVQVLIGTQLVSKGHDFEGVSFVGILDADSSLNYPNYRNSEMTYSLITQTIGRAGRFNERGEAIIQTRDPENKIIKFAAEQDYEKFLNYEYHQREIFGYPPACGLLSLCVRGNSAKEVIAFGERIRDFVISENVDKVKVSGPSTVYLKRGKSECNVVVRYKKFTDVKTIVEDLLSFYKLQNKVNLVVNLNPFTY